MNKPTEGADLRHHGASPDSSRDGPASDGTTRAEQAAPRPSGPAPSSLAPAAPGTAHDGPPAQRTGGAPRVGDRAGVRTGDRRHDGAGPSRPHESAHLHVAGAAPYIDDLPELAGTLHAALGLSPLANGRLTALHLDRVRALPGVVTVLSAADIPGLNDCGPILHDDPILASGEVRHVGQPVFLVVADTREAARRAAAQARQVLEIEPLPAIFTPEAAHRAGAYVLPPMHLARGDARAAIEAAPHRIRGRFDVGGQEQFYLEGQISYALPQENDGLLVHCSTQHPSEMQHHIATMLKLQSHHVQVVCRRMGGGFGGKESQSALFACAAALAAQRLRRPVKLRVDRDDDFLITGRRHCFWYEYDAGYDDEGRVLGLELTMVSRAGHSADLSGPVMTRAICHVDNAYFLPAVAIHGYSGRTNTQSNTAFRGFGGPQGAIATENLLDSIARALGKDALDVRRANFYGIGSRDVTPYGQRVEDNLIHEITAQLERDSEYRARRAGIDAFNATSPVIKRGLALTPVKFGISFNVVHLNQAGALVHVYADGSVLVNHGGTEMGQGLNTKVAQVVAHELGVVFEAVRVSATDTQKIVNTSATAASTGSDLNGKAAQDAARQIRERLCAFAAAHYGGDASDVRFADGVVEVGPLPKAATPHDPAGARSVAAAAAAATAPAAPTWRAEAPAAAAASATAGAKTLEHAATPAAITGGTVPVGAPHFSRAASEATARDVGSVLHADGSCAPPQATPVPARRVIPFSELVAAAYMARVQLWSDGFYATPGLHWDRNTLQGKPFFYYAYGAAVSEVAVDTLSGEFKLLRADVLHDAGHSINPAVDIGQVEGGFMQGMGWLTMEELVWHPQSGLLTTHAPSTYKIPTANDSPEVFNVRLFDAANAADTIHRSKATGEPPLLLAFSVFYAIRDAVSAAGRHRIDPPLSAPATNESILRALAVVTAAAENAPSSRP